MMIHLGHSPYCIGVALAGPESDKAVITFRLGDFALLANPNCAVGAPNCNCAVPKPAPKPGAPLSEETLAEINRKRAEREERVSRVETLNETISQLERLVREERRRCQDLTLEIRTLVEPGSDPSSW